MSKNRINTEKRNNITLALEAIANGLANGTDQDLAAVLNLTAACFKDEYNANCLRLPYAEASAEFQRIATTWNTLQAAIKDKKAREKNTFFFLAAARQTEAAPAPQPDRNRKRKDKGESKEARKPRKQTGTAAPLVNTAEYIRASKVPAKGETAFSASMKKAVAARYEHAHA